MSKRVVILGGGSGGTLVANRLRRFFPVDELELTVVDQDDRHVYQPGCPVEGFPQPGSGIRPDVDATPEMRFDGADNPGMHRGAAGWDVSECQG